MKKGVVILAVTVMALSFSQVCMAAPRAAAVVNMSLGLDGFCDGIDLSIDMGSGLVTGTATGCYSHNSFGTVGTVSTQGVALTLGQSGDSPFPGLMYVIRQDGTWSNYYEADGEMHEMNAGTWTPVTAMTPGNLPKSDVGSAE